LKSELYGAVRKGFLMALVKIEEITQWALRLSRTIPTRTSLFTKTGAIKLKSTVVSVSMGSANIAIISLIRMR